MKLLEAVVNHGKLLSVEGNQYDFVGQVIDQEDMDLLHYEGLQPLGREASLAMHKQEVEDLVEAIVDSKPEEPVQIIAK